MAWTPQLDGFAKAALKKVQSIMQDAVPDLQLAFASDTNLSVLTNTYSPLGDGTILRGDYEGMWDINKGGYLRIFLSSGGHREGIALTESTFYIGTGNTPGNKKRNYSFLITCLFHEKAFNLGNVDLQSQYREDAYITLMDWLDFDCWGTNANRKFQVNSNCFDNLTGKDEFRDVSLSSVGKIWTPTGAGGTQILTGISAVLTGFA